VNHRKVSIHIAIRAWLGVAVGEAVAGVILPVAGIGVDVGGSFE